MGKIFLNGEYIPKEEAKISVFDRGFLFGDGLFETMKAYKGIPLMLEKHLDRLFNGAEEMKIVIPYSRGELSKIIYILLEINQLKEAYLRLTVTRGVGKPGLDPKGCEHPTVLIVASQLTPYPEEAYVKGWEVSVVETLRNHPQALKPHIKSLNFLNNIFARIEASEVGSFEGIMLNHSGYVTEGTVSNVFIVKNEQVITPSLELGLLPGIVREEVLELCIRNGIKSTEGKFTMTELEAADECFITNSLAEVLPVVKVNGNTINTGKPGLITRQIAKLYKKTIDDYLRRFLDERTMDN
ncbi:branched-chain amino acid aminotransferase [Desulfitispora alkaliphila]|uniref:aminotransferase class IV n=1 Tax=Desulfitispora alkaliphila TaxID=622674 RepID=UPI003D2551BB